MFSLGMLFPHIAIDFVLDLDMLILYYIVYNKFCVPKRATCFVQYIHTHTHTHIYIGHLQRHTILKVHIEGDNVVGVAVVLVLIVVILIKIA
jgi:hypothetical protein